VALPDKLLKLPLRGRKPFVGLSQVRKPDGGALPPFCEAKFSNPAAKEAVSHRIPLPANPLLAPAPAGLGDHDPNLHGKSSKRQYQRDAADYRADFSRACRGRCRLVDHNRRRTHGFGGGRRLNFFLKLDGRLRHTGFRGRRSRSHFGGLFLADGRNWRWCDGCSGCGGRRFGCNGRCSCRFDGLNARRRRRSNGCRGRRAHGRNPGCRRRCRRLRGRGRRHGTRGWLGWCRWHRRSSACAGDRRQAGRFRGNRRRRWWHDRGRRNGLSHRGRSPGSLGTSRRRFGHRPWRKVDHRGFPRGASKWLTIPPGGKDNSDCFLFGLGHLKEWLGVFAHKGAWNVNNCENVAWCQSVEHYATHIFFCNRIVTVPLVLDNSPGNQAELQAFREEVTWVSGEGRGRAPRKDAWRNG